MVTMAQRIEELRTERNMSRSELSRTLGLPKNAAEKFETGRQTPTHEQQNKLADFFGVSIFYLRGESNDRTRQETWMDGDFVDDEPAAQPKYRPAAVSAPTRAAPSSSTSGGSLVDPFLKNKAFQEMVRATVLDVLRSPEGQELLGRAVRHELNRR